MMKVICIDNIYSTLTLSKVYDVISESYLFDSDYIEDISGKYYRGSFYERLPSNCSSSNFKKAYRIMCDDNITRYYTEKVLIPIIIWRETQLNSLLNIVKE